MLHSFDRVEPIGAVVGDISAQPVHPIPWTCREQTTKAAPMVEIGLGAATIAEADALR